MAVTSSGVSESPEPQRGDHDADDRRGEQSQRGRDSRQVPARRTSGALDWGTRAAGRSLLKRVVERRDGARH